MDDEFIKREEEEQGKEFEEEAEEDYEYLDYDYDNLERIPATITQPEVTTWVGPDGTTTLEGVVFDWPILGRSKNISVFNDVCPICFKALKGSGIHQICCLPCGHIYGRSCINQWLQQSHQSSNKCPQCKSLCTLKDVSLLCATRPSDAVGALPKVSTKRFPFTQQGFKAFKQYALQRLDDESGMRLDAARRSHYARQQRNEIYRQQNSSLQHRISSLRNRICAYHKGIYFFAQRYKEHMTRDKNECKSMETRELPQIPSQSPSVAPSPTPTPSGIDLSYLHVPKLKVRKQNCAEPEEADVVEPTFRKRRPTRFDRITHRITMDFLEWVRKTPGRDFLDIVSRADLGPMGSEPLRPTWLTKQSLMMFESTFGGSHHL